MAVQLNFDETHLQGERIEGMVVGLSDLNAASRSTQVGSQLALRAVGRLLDEVTDPFALEVHRPMELDNRQTELPALPAYVPRDHDDELAGVVQAAAEGSSRFAALIGGSSTGKTRACWEALLLLRNEPLGWRLCHPIDPTRPEALLRELPGMGPRTVVWLNEAQFYLGTPGRGLGERVAAGLRELLRDPARSPVLVLATMWPEFWDTLVTRPASGSDPHAQARELLSGHDIAVPTAFSAAQLRSLAKAEDERVAAAAAASESGHVIQFLAGAPELLARYRNAPPAARALLHAAMDARRMGIGPILSHAFLESAAPGYLSDSEWDQLGEDWLEQALAFMAAPCRGVPGPLTPVRPRHTGRAAGSGDVASISATGPNYRLADYLDQVGRRRRRTQIPPASLWDAAVACAPPGELGELGAAAQCRGLYRHAAQLYKKAVARGDPYPACELIYLFEKLEPTDRRPAAWVSAQVPIDNPEPVAWLFDALNGLDSRGLDAKQHIATLADRAAPYAQLSDARAVAGLLEAMRVAGVGDRSGVLLQRDPAAHVTVDDLHATASLFDELLRAGGRDQAIMLVERWAAATAVSDPAEVASLLTTLLRRRAMGQVIALANRDPASRVRLDDARPVGLLLSALREAGATEQVTALLTRDPASSVGLDDAGAVGLLLSALREAGATEQVTALVNRDPASRVRLEDAGSVAILLNALREAGAPEQVTALVRRDPAAHVRLDFTSNGLGLRSVTQSLRMLWDAGARDQAASLADRVVAHAPLHNLLDVSLLIGTLRKVGGDRQVTTLLNRHPAVLSGVEIAMLLNAAPQANTGALAERAAAAPLEDPHSVAMVLYALQRAGAGSQITTLLNRNPASYVRLDDAPAVASLLDALRKVGAGEQIAALLSRDPASQVRVGREYDATRLLEGLHDADAQEQACVLIDRLPGEGLFWIWLQEQELERFRFGRNADGQPAQSWGWQDLD